jgi:hypothetical protein
MRRREFITLLGGAAVATWPLTLNGAAEDPCDLSTESRARWADQIRAFPQGGLNDTGYVEVNVLIEYRFALACQRHPLGHDTAKST